MAGSYHQLGMLAQDRGDYDEAARQYQRSLDISERLGDQAGMATSYHQLGMLAQDRGDYDEAARQYQRSLDINERLGDQAGMAASYHQLGILAQAAGTTTRPPASTSAPWTSASGSATRPAWPAATTSSASSPRSRGDYDEAARQYQRSLDISERIGDQAGTARSYHHLGMLAQDRGDYDEAARQYQRALDINERLGNQAGMAPIYSQLGILEKDRGGPAATAITWHVKALAIRLRLGVPQAVIDLRRLAAYRSGTGPGPFTSILAQAAGSPDLAEAITALLDQLDNTDDATA